MSGLKLNMAKTVLIPLFPCRLIAFRHKSIHCDHPTWNNVSVAHEGTYLGFMIGPNGHTRQWKKAIAKYVERVPLGGSEPRSSSHRLCLQYVRCLGTFLSLAALHSSPGTP
eukprot:7420980-Heterocapsa_arctica.AAC.1